MKNDAPPTPRPARDERELAELLARGRLIGPAISLLGLLDLASWRRGGDGPYLVLGIIAVLGGLAVAVVGVSAYRHLRGDRAARRGQAR